MLDLVWKPHHKEHLQYRKGCRQNTHLSIPHNVQWYVLYTVSALSCLFRFKNMPLFYKVPVRIHWGPEAAAPVSSVRSVVQISLCWFEMQSNKESVSFDQNKSVVIGHVLRVPSHLTSQRVGLGTAVMPSKGSLILLSRKWSFSVCWGHFLLNTKRKWLCPSRWAML